MPQQTPNQFSPSPKQIVFLFMAATVVAVVVFLFGLLVGRGVPLDLAVSGQGAQDAGSSISYMDERPATILERQSAEPSAAVLTGDEFSYSERLHRNQSSAEDDLLGTVNPEERLSVDAPRPMPDGDEDDIDRDNLAVAEITENPRPLLMPDQSDRSKPLPTQSRPVVEEGGFTVQVMSLRDRTAAERVAAGLVEKGYEAFVAPPIDGAPVPVFRVRVGRYSDREEAEQIKNRLEQNEELKPWITQ